VLLLFLVILSLLTYIQHIGLYILVGHLHTILLTSVMHVSYATRVIRRDELLLISTNHWTSSTHYKETDATRPDNLTIRQVNTRKPDTLEDLRNRYIKRNF